MSDFCTELLKKTVCECGNECVRDTGCRDIDLFLQGQGYEEWLENGVVENPQLELPPDYDEDLPLDM